MSLKDELAAMGVEMEEDDHMVMLRCGDREQVFSACGVTRETIIRAAFDLRMGFAVAED